MSEVDVQRRTVVGEWQPINTAPKDYSLKLLGTDGYTVTLMARYGDGWEDLDKDADCDSRFQPTYWMVPPCPP